MKIHWENINWINVISVCLCCIFIIAIIMLAAKVNKLTSTINEYEEHKEYKNQLDSLDNLYNENKLILKHKQEVIEDLSYLSDSLISIIDALSVKNQKLIKSREILKQENTKKLNEIIQSIDTSADIRDSLRNVYFPR